MNNAHSPGKVLDYVNGTGATIAAGTFLAIGALVGCVVADIPDGETGAVAIEGAFTAPKTAGAAWTQGAILVFDVSAGEFGTPAQITEATGDVTGGAVAFAAAASGDTSGVVLLTPSGTVT